MFLYSGGSVHIWHDQWATSWSLPTRNVIPHTKLNSEYILSPEMPQIKKKKVTLSGNTSLSGFVWQGGLVGLFLGLALTLWVGIGGQLYPPTSEMTNPLPLTTVGCIAPDYTTPNYTTPSYTTPNYTTPALSTTPVTLHNPPRSVAQNTKVSCPLKGPRLLSKSWCNK